VAIEEHNMIVYRRHSKYQLRAMVVAILGVQASKLPEIIQIFLDCVISEEQVLVSVTVQSNIFLLPQLHKIFIVVLRAQRGLTPK
jgi:hypothetical protein